MNCVSVSTLSSGARSAQQLTTSTHFELERCRTWSHRSHAVMDGTPIPSHPHPQVVFIRQRFTIRAKRLLLAENIAIVHIIRIRVIKWPLYVVRVVGHHSMLCYDVLCTVCEGRHVGFVHSHCAVQIYSHLDPHRIIQSTDYST